MSKIALLNNEVNDIQTNMKETVKNMITNIKDMHDINEKSAEIRDTSYQFQKDSTILEKQIRFQKIIAEYLVYCIFAIILVILLYLIFK